MLFIVFDTGLTPMQVLYKPNLTIVVGLGIKMCSAL